MCVRSSQALLTPCFEVHCLADLHLSRCVAGTSQMFRVCCSGHAVQPKYCTVSIPSASCACQDFLDISNPKAVLETTLRGYACLTKGDCICLHYNNKRYYIDIIEAKPEVCFRAPHAPWPLCARATSAAYCLHEGQATGASTISWTAVNAHEGQCTDMQPLTLLTVGTDTPCSQHSQAKGLS